MRILRPSRPTIPRLRSAEGFSLVVALLMLLISSSIVAVVLTLATSDINLTQRSTNQKRAYAAALAGIEDYQFQLNHNATYWETCPAIPTRAVPGDSAAAFAVKTLPAPEHECQAGVKSTFASIIQSPSNTFRIESTGTVKYGGGETTRTIIASFATARFTEFVYFSNYEVQDPATYLYDGRAPVNCEHYYAERKADHYTAECPPIQFVSEDSVNGSMHTNDAALVCGSPTFGRPGDGDKIEMVGGYYAEGNGCSATPKFNGTYEKGGETITIPPSDDELESLADDKFTGRTEIKLENTGMTVKNAKLPGGSVKEAFPANGVIYVENASAGCTEDYTSAAPSYEEPNCGNVYVKGKYTESLTIAAERDVIINGDIVTTTKNNEVAAEPIGTATLGLIANKFVRVYHPVEPPYTTTTTRTDHGYTEVVTVEHNIDNSEECTAPNVPGEESELKNLVIDASILTTDNSFIVDNFKCGAPLGTLTVWGSITQNWRGPVDTGDITSGYAKNYNYDERLKASNPPDFLNPSSGHWRVYRENGSST